MTISVPSERRGDPAAPEPEAATRRLPSDADCTGRSFGAEELTLLEEVIRSGTLTSVRGIQVRAFEREFADYYGRAHCCAVSSGTAAVHSAVAAVQIRPGDEVVTTPITDMGAITPILYEGGVPVFADVDPRTLNLTAEAVERALTPRTRLVIATHLFGNPCDVEAIRELARGRSIPLIEDCAQAYLATVRDRRVGSFGELAVFSMQQGKHISTGEGGIVITDDPVLARRVRLFVNKGWDYDEADSDHYFRALNYRMTELQGAVARAQLTKLGAVVLRRQEAARRLTDLLADCPGLLPPQVAPGAEHVYWRYPLLVTGATGRDVDRFGGRLREQGVSCSPRYIRRLAFECALFTGREEAQFERARFPGAVEGLSRVVVLPWNERYGEDDVRFLASAIRRAHESSR